GIGYSRIVGGRIDIGAYERQIDPDFNNDGFIDGIDIDLLQSNIVHGPQAPRLFDLTHDGIVDIRDRDQWLIEAGQANLDAAEPYLLGDANLDGQVDVGDFNRWNTNRFTESSAWTDGDFNVDGVVDVSDFAIWNEFKFSASLPPNAVLADEFYSDERLASRTRAIVDVVFGGLHDNDVSS
ncbi:MAG: hypothetical protein AAF497_20370, partial [Planctomycetota bacterium]